MRRIMTVPLLAAVLMGASSCDAADPPPDPIERAVALRDRLHAQVLEWISQDQLARPNGAIYAIDVTQLAIYAAQRHDRELYDTMRTIIVEQLLVPDDAGEFTRGFVAWRVTPGEPLDATGTTEMLRAAEALWLGGKTFDQPDDIALAHRILAAYARHEATDQGVWLIRNYYNLGTRAFATNSYLVDYDPDLLRRAADATGDATLRRVADASADLVRKAVTPAGLLYLIIQPEVLTLTPEGSAIFAPNNLVQLGNSATVAERSVASCPEVARQVLDFATGRLPDLRTFYDAASGEPRTESWAGAASLSPVVRLAVKLNDQRAAAPLLERLLEAGEAYANHPVEPRLYTASELLLTLQAVLDATAE